MIIKYSFWRCIIFFSFILSANITISQGNSTAYCSSIVVQDSFQVSFYSPTMFRFRKSALDSKDKFPAKYEIPFLIGNTKGWQPVRFTANEDDDFIYLNTDSLQIRIEKKSLSWSIWDQVGKNKICPSSGPVYGMFKDGYTIFDNVSAFDSPSKISRYSHWFYNKKTDSYTDVYLEEKLIEDKYFIYGPTYELLFKQFNDLVGPEPILPKKGFGYYQTQHLSCEGSQVKLLEVARKFRENKIPLDFLILDFEWGDGCDGNKEIKWGSSLQWNKTYSVPLSPENMIKVLDSMNIELILIHHSAPDFKNRKQQGWTESLYDENIWWNSYIDKLEMGIRGTWQDTRLNDITDAFIYTNTKKYYNGLKRPLFLGSRKMMSFNPWDFRFSVMPTENMIGARRYPFHWTEDCSFSWNELAFQIKAISNTYGPLHGYSYLSSDGIGSNWKIQARWNQFSALSGVARSHNSKPWSGTIDVSTFVNSIRISDRDITDKQTTNSLDTSQTAEESFRKYLGLRYQLLPYLYSYAFVNYFQGMPILRPMLLAFPEDYTCSSDAWPHQFMLGDYLLIAPVYGDFKSMEIYLPKGNDWIDYNTNKEYKDGGIITYNTEDVNTLPIFVRKGAIIPYRQKSNWINSAISDSITLEVYPNQKATSFALYDDDGTTMEYEKGVYNKLLIECIKGNGIRISGRSKHRGFIPDKSVITGIKVHGVNSKPVSVSIDGNDYNHYYYDYNLKQLIIKDILFNDEWDIVIK